MKIIFQDPRRINQVFDAQDRYILEHTSSGAQAIFDHSQKALRVVKTAITKSGPFYFSPSTSFETNSGQRLVQLLYKTYSGKNLTWIRKGLITFRNGDKFDFRSKNLCHSRESSCSTPVRHLIHTGNLIKIRHRRSGADFYCDYDPELFELLCDGRLSWSYQADTERIALFIQRNGKRLRGSTMCLHNLIWAFWHCGARTKNLIGRVRAMKRDFNRPKNKSDRLTVDHLDANQRNNCRWNLSAMTVSQNSRKKDLFKKIREPFHFYGVCSCDGYRVACGRECETGGGKQIKNRFIICPDAEALIDLLKTFLQTPWIDGRTPAQNYKDHPDAFHFAEWHGSIWLDNDPEGLDVRQGLLLMERDLFTIWLVGDTFEYDGVLSGSTTS